MVRRSLVRSGFRAVIACVLAGTVACDKAAVVDEPDTSIVDAGTTTTVTEPGVFDVAGIVTSEDGRVAAGAPSTKVVVLWDARRSGESFPLKFGEGTITAGKISVRLASAPPDLALVNGAVAVGNLIAVSAETVIPDGELTLDQADELLESAIGGMNGMMAVFKADSSIRFPWLDAFPDGLSCARSTGAGFEKTECAQASTRMAARTAEGAMPFTEWQPPPGAQPRSPD